jgi:tripartite-type tricarboxylate transporter receptor subunit TctC
MRIVNSDRLALFAAAAIVALAPAAASAQAWPARPVTMIVPFPAGGPADVLARVLAGDLSKQFGQQVVVDNRTGAGGNIGGAAVAKAAPDGYTILFGTPGPLANNKIMYKKPGYDPQKDFAPVVLIAKSPLIIVANPNTPAKNLKELIAYAKANPGKLTFATQGPGSTAHLSAAQLEVLAGIKMVAVPYRGAQLALNDIIAGNVDMFFDTLATSVPLYRGGKLRILAVAGLERAKTAPELPTFPEAGVAGFRSITWFGLAAPPATPAALQQRLNRDVVEILRSKEVGERLQSISLEVGALSPAETMKFFNDEAALWNNVIKQAGIAPR